MGRSRARHGRQDFACTTILLGIGAVIAVPALAQEQVSRSGLEEVVVTAQRREQSLQSVPISVSALSGQDLTNSGVVSTEDIQQAAPGFTWGTSLNTASPFIRGVGSTDSSIANEPSAAVYVDGIYYPDMPGIIFGLSNVERIEVLRGPQGTLFGRNATAGLVQIVTRTPSHTPQAEFKVGYGNYDTKEGALYVTGGLGEALAADFSAAYSDQSEGWGRNTTTGEETNLQEELALRTKWLLDLSEDTSFTLAADYVDRKAGRGSERGVLPGTIGTDNTTVGTSIYDTQGTLAYLTSDEPFTEQWGANLRFEHGMGFGQFVSLSSYRELDALILIDQDVVPGPIVGATLDEASTTFSQELQLLSPADSRVSWIVGAFYMDRTAQNEPFLLATGPTVRFNRFTKQKTESIAGYGQLTVGLGQSTNLTLGARYTSDTQKYTALETNALTGVPTRTPAPQESSFEEPTWRIALDHQFSEGFMAFASYNRGFKAGLYNATNPVSPPAGPEILDAYEIGMKWDLLDERLRLNASAFFYQYDDLQVQTVIANVANTINAAEAELYGGEIELLALPVDNLQLRLGVAVLSQAEYTSFPDAVVTAPRPGTPGGVIQVSCTPDPSVCDVSGNTMIRAPEYTASAAIDYTVPVGTGELGFSVSYYYNDGYFWLPDNRLTQPSYSVLNAQVRWTLPGDMVTLTAWGKNLADEEYATQVVAQLSDAVIPAPPRTYGLTVGFKF